jgi:hypothetical protein
MLPTLAERLSHVEDPETVRRRDSELRERLALLAALRLEDRDALTIDWAGEEGVAILTSLVTDLYEDMADLED